MKGYIIPEEDEKSIGVQQENATFLVIGDKAYTSEIIEEYNNNAEAKTMITLLLKQKNLIIM